MRDEMGRDQQINALDKASSKRFLGLSHFMINSRREAVLVGGSRQGKEAHCLQCPLCSQSRSSLGLGEQ